MNKIKTCAGIFLLTAGLSGCVGYVGDSSPYYGGVAPYYGTAYVPAYAYGEVVVQGDSHPYHASQHVYSHYNTDYWHHQRSAPQAAAHGNEQRGGQPHQNAQPHNAPEHSGEHGGGHGGEQHGGGRGGDEHH